MPCWWLAFSHGEFRQGGHQLSAQHRRWNPRRNFRFRRGTGALAEPKDDRSANEIARDNSFPPRFSFLHLPLPASLPPSLSLLSGSISGFASSSSCARANEREETHLAPMTLLRSIVPRTRSQCSDSQKCLDAIFRELKN